MLGTVLNAARAKWTRVRLGEAAVKWKGKGAERMFGARGGPPTVRVSLMHPTAESTDRRVWLQFEFGAFGGDYWVELGQLKKGRLDFYVYSKGGANYHVYGYVNPEQISVMADAAMEQLPPLAGLGNVKPREWKDDWTSKLKRTEKRWAWREAIHIQVLEFEPRFPLATFERRWRLIQSALEAAHDDEAAPFRELEMALIILGDAHVPDRDAASARSTARRLAKRYFAPYEHFFSWLEE